MFIADKYLELLSAFSLSTYTPSHVPRVEVSHFAFIASVVPAAICAVVLLAAYGGSEEGRVALFGPSGLLGWTQSPGLALAQVVTSLLGGKWASHLKRGRGRSGGDVLRILWWLA